MARYKTGSFRIYSIFGQCEEAAALHMIEKYKLSRIEWNDIPEGERVNEFNEQAKFAILVPAAHVSEFLEVCGSLRA